MKNIDIFMYVSIVFMVVFGLALSFIFGYQVFYYYGLFDIRFILIATLFSVIGLLAIIGLIKILLNARK